MDFNCSYASGFVRDILGRPLLGATVYTEQGCGEMPRSTSTDADGHYRIGIYKLLAGQVPATASKTGFVSQTKNITSGVQDLAANDFELYYDIDANLSPGAIRSGQSVTITAATTAPPPNSTPGSRVIAQLPAGGRMNLTQGVTDADGTTHWSGVHSTGALTLEGQYTIKVCAVDKLYGGNCDQAAALGPPNIVTPVRALSYWVDNSGPVVSASSPPPFGNTLKLSALSVTWQDTTGLDPDAFVLRIDGQVRSITISGQTVSTNASSLAYGIHIVTADAKDVVGNPGTKTFLFTLVSLAASGGTATLQERTVDVNPTNKIPPPTKVKFVAPKVDISETFETLSASTGVGHGTVRRGLTLGSVSVVFKNGALTQTVSVTPPSATESHSVGTLSPSAGSSRATIPAHTVTISDIEVNVPAGYNTRQSQATLKAKTVSLGAPILAEGPFIGSAWENTVPILGTIGACFAGNGSGVVAECQVDTSARVYAKVGAVLDVRQIYVPTVPIPDNSLDGTVPQACSGCVSPESIREGTASLVLRCPTTAVAGRSINLCSGIPDAPATAGPWAAYLNAWLYKEDTRFPLWQQNHAQGASSSCPNGADGLVSGGTYRLVANTTALDGSTGAVIGGTWDDPFNPSLLEEYVYLGTKTGNSRPGQLDEDPSIVFQLSNESLQGGATVPLQILGQGTYLSPNPSGVIDAAGSLTATASGTTNGWQHGTDPVSNGAGTADRLQIMTGTEFRSPTQANTYNVLASLALQFVLDFSQCS